jgi:hypothetical protein
VEPGVQYISVVDPGVQYISVVEPGVQYISVVEPGVQFLRGRLSTMHGTNNIKFIAVSVQLYAPNASIP